MDLESEKKDAAKRALRYLDKKMILGIGTGSTVRYFIEALASNRDAIDCIETIVSSSSQTTEQLKALGFQVTPFPHVGYLDLYIDGADEINPHGVMIKGGGGALTQEKILAYSAQLFVCIADSSKKVELLGKKHPVPIEVIPMARSAVARKIVSMGGQPVYREHFVTDNGHIILDCHHMKILNPLALESELNQIPGAICNGIFAARSADHVIIGKKE